MVFCMIAAMTFLSSRARAQPIADPCAGTLPQGSFLQPPACPEFPAPCNPLFGDTISSCDHRFFMTMQGDGNLVLYQQNGPGNYAALWSSNTFTGGPANHAAMQGDGNFVVYNNIFTPQWASGTYGTPYASLSVQADGNAVIYSWNPYAGVAPRPVWSTGTCCRALPLVPATCGTIPRPSGYGYYGLFPSSSVSSCDGRFVLKMQTDGNLVLYQVNTIPSRALWWSGTNGSGAQYAVMLPDGNFLVYQQGHGIWATNTGGNWGAQLAVQNDGNVVIYATDGRAIWATNTCCR